ncbi:MAG: hypothetical protein LH470_11630 [Lysobacter sp.]|nr:hypothetical protein [Lysobacter sp.]
MDTRLAHRFALLPVSVLALAVFVIVLLAQWPLARNPGYFSHDELQWAVFAAQGADIDWTALQTFQYRPLTFDVWSWLSRTWFERPQAFHTVVVAGGAMNAALLAILGRHLGMAPLAAVLGAIAFALGPSAMYVHGWVGTLGDLIWVGCALLLGIVIAGRPHVALIAASSLLLTTVALLAKEAAVSIPALLAVGWLCLGRGRHWGMAAVLSALPVVVYLALRIGVLLFSAQHGNAYDWSLLHVPQRWLEYQLFAPNVAVFEAVNTLSGGFGSKRVLLSVLLWLATTALLMRIGWRWAAAFLLGGLAVLGPVLVLGAATNQYGYGFAALCAGVLAAAWGRAGDAGRCLIVILALLNLWHGANVMRDMRRVGEVQAVFSPTLAAQLGTATDATPLRLRIAPGADEWIFGRLTHQIPSYRGVRIGNRVQLVEADAAADYRVEADGRLTSLR